MAATNQDQHPTTAGYPTALGTTSISHSRAPTRLLQGLLRVAQLFQLLGVLAQALMQLLEGPMVAAVVIHGGCRVKHGGCRVAASYAL